MMYCQKHCHWYNGFKCDMCVDNEPPYLRSRDEVADPQDWKFFVKKGWVKW